ncbi:MAG: anhydro-N-acetylmuramic acid kinase [candidate division Zixibacteria bacterium]|nr:anhydro-N-acetylmuramic acid kinase [candidate division Zixibacteria bacterium]
MKPAASHPLVRLLRRRRLNVVGVNSGTSIDGLDLALVQITEDDPHPTVRYVNAWHRHYPLRLRESLMSLAASPAIDREAAARAHFALGEFIASCVLMIKNSARSARIDLIGSHGQTIGHFPLGRGIGFGRGRATWQMGAPSVIAHRTGVVTVGDFRAADIAAGGMGAPLSGYYHHILFGEGAVVLNLGGIANVSVSRRRRGRLEILAFDIGPGNMMLDGLARLLLGSSHDHNGHAASRGRPMARILETALADGYFRRPPPKTCGREEFGEATLQRWFFRGSRPLAGAADLLATATEITAVSIARAVEPWIAPMTLSRRLIVAGGGAQNPTLVRRLGAHLPGWSIGSRTDRGIHPQCVEPVGFALLAYETLRGRAGNLGGATGAHEAAVLGVIALPGPTS